ncbi:MAG: molecular chaperone HscC [Planctomycetaceae bacterium]|nr:molecular chaperone HscC [Planctomycetaceae bacterium]
MTEIVGIDLGTTNSLVAYLTPDGPQIIPNSLGEPLTPSVVGIDEQGHILVGRTARELQVVRPECCASLFKRLMGTEEKTRIMERTFSPEELSSLVLRSLKQDAEAFLGHPVNRAVITVPAYFNDQQRKSTITAGKIAGFQVDRIINEPTAAAMAYGFHESREQKLLFVFDLGGGTFDVSLVELFEGVLEVRASSGESFLGGEDFTRAIAARILESQGLIFERAELDHPRLVARLMQQCEKLKKNLSTADLVEIRIPNVQGEFDDDSLSIPITREQFDGWSKTLLDRLAPPVRRVIGDAKVGRNDIDEVILVGGATRMPSVVKYVTELLGKTPHSRRNPDHVVALGAAVLAGLIENNAAVEDLVVTDVSPFTLGVETTKEIGFDYKSGFYLPIIHRNTTIPTSMVQRVCTILPNQPEVNVKIYQGESRRVEQNLFIGEFRVTGIPRGPAGQPIDIRFTYDLNGVLEVQATIVQTGQTYTHVVTRFARGLSPSQINAAVSEMQKLKVSPREEARNQFLLKRAERLISELPFDLREQLEQLLDGFESALETRSPDEIRQYQEILEEFFDRFDSGENYTDQYQ